MNLQSISKNYLETKQNAHTYEDKFQIKLTIIVWN